MLTGGVHGRARPFIGSQVRNRPLRDREFGVAGVVAVLDPVPVLVERHTATIDKNRPERLVTVVKGLAREIHASVEAVEVIVADRHRR
jgi:hypothetical protein